MDGTRFLKAGCLARCRRWLISETNGVTPMPAATCVAHQTRITLSAQHEVAAATDDVPAQWFRRG